MKRPIIGYSEHLILLAVLYDSIGKYGVSVELIIVFILLNIMKLAAGFCAGLLLKLVEIRVKRALTQNVPSGSSLIYSSTE